MVDHAINAVLFRPGDTFEGFTIGDSFLTGDLQAWNVTHAKGAACLYGRRKRNASEKEIAAFKERAERLKNFSSPLLPAVISYGYAPATRCFWLATEPVHGVSLQKIFEVSRTLIPLLRCFVIFAGIAALLEEAEGHGFHHYALSPKTVYVSEKTTVCCIADLGIIEVFDAKPPRPTYESVAYCAPDLLRGELSAAVDIYAAGMILWELMARRQPLRATRSGPIALDDDMVSALEGLELPTLAALSVPVPSFVSTFVQRTIAKTRAARLGTWGQVISEGEELTKAWYPILVAAPPDAASGAASSSEAAALPAPIPSSEAAAPPALLSEAAVALSSAIPPSDATAQPAPSSGAAAAPSSAVLSSGAAAAPSAAAPPRGRFGPIAVSLLSAVFALAALAIVLGARQPPAPSSAPSAPLPVNVTLTLPPSLSAPGAPETPTSSALVPPRPSYPRAKEIQIPWAEAPSRTEEPEVDAGATGGPERDPELSSQQTLKKNWPFPKPAPSP
jgi:serine/threonine protein kinase